MLKYLFFSALTALYAQTALIAELKTTGIADLESVQMIESRIFEIASQSDTYKTHSQDKQRRLLSNSNVLLPSYCDEICWSDIAQQVGTDVVLLPSLSKDGRYMLLELKLLKSGSQEPSGQTQVYISGGVSKAISTAFAQLTDNSSNNDDNSLEGEQTQWITGLGYVAASASLIWIATSYLSIDDDTEENSLKDQSSLPSNF